MTTLTTHPVPTAPPPWSDVADAIWRRSLAEQHAAICRDLAGCTHYKSPRRAEMSTNYYVHTPDGQEIHLGKTAVGWPFTFRGYPERGVVDYASWRAQFDLGVIRNEYGAEVGSDEMEDIVDNQRRTWGMHRVPPRPGRGQVDDANGNRFSCYEFC